MVDQGASGAAGGALAPWADEIGPTYVLKYRPPAELRRIAREMTAAAHALRVIAKANETLITE